MSLASADLIKRIHHIHAGCFNLVRESIGTYLPVAGNIGIFCQSEAEYEAFGQLAKALTEPSNNPKQKYFRLKEGIVINAEGGQEYRYTYLYVRQPDKDSPQAGDIDFVLDDSEFQLLKERVSNGEVSNATVYERPGWDMVELSRNDIDALAYICTSEMAQKVRVKF